MEAKHEGSLGAFTLAEEIERFQPGEAGSGRRAETLIKTDRPRVALVTMRRRVVAEGNLPYQDEGRLPRQDILRYTLRAAQEGGSLGECFFFITRVMEYS